MGNDSDRVGHGYPGSDRRVGDRRRRKERVFLDRRSGFDRRATAAGAGGGIFQSVLLGLRDRPPALLILLGLVNIFNFADFSLTLNALSAGGREANPLMRSLLALDPVWAGLFKAAAVLLASWIVWRLRRYRLALQATLAVAAILSAVLLYHVVGLVLLS